MNAPDPHQPPTADPASPRRDRRLLIVEDNPLFVEQLSDAVGRVPGRWHVQALSEGSKAIAALGREVRQVEYDLALIDLGLPDVSGVEVIRAYRARFPDLPIVVISVTAAESSVLSAITAGASGYLLKNESVDAIALALSQVLDGIYPLSPALARHLFKRLSDTGADKRGDSRIKLTARELETLQHLSRGCRYEEAAERMGVALSTIQWNVRNLYRKLKVHSQVQAISKARDHGLL